MKNTFIIGGLIIVLAAGYVYVSVKKQGSLTPLPTPQPQTTVVGSSTAPNTDTLDQRVDPTLVLGVFKGVLPCADCPGIETELTLVKEDADAAEGSYSMSSIYQERNVEPFIERGTWTTLRGTKTNPNATVYQLTSGSGGSQYFLQVNDNELKMLDSEQQEIDSALNFTLTRVAE